MTEPLCSAVSKVGENERDLTEGYGSQTDLEGLMEFMHSYDVTADPDNDRYLLQDEEHQYEVQILQVESDNDLATTVAKYNGFAKEGLEEVDVLYEEEFEQNPKDGAIFNNGSDALWQASERAPERK